jgi:hypothetical protein
MSIVYVLTFLIRHSPHKTSEAGTSKLKHGPEREKYTIIILRW